MTIWNSTCNPCSTFDQFIFVFHGLKSCFCYSLKLNFICYLNRFIPLTTVCGTGGDIHFCGQKQTLILVTLQMFTTQSTLLRKGNVLIRNPISLHHRTLLCLPFERRETYCFSLIFSSASSSSSSASSQRSLSGP